MDHLGKLDQVIDYLKGSTNSAREQSNFQGHISSRYNIELLLEKYKQASELVMDRGMRKPSAHLGEPRYHF